MTTDKDIRQGGISELTEQECMALIPTTTVGRVAFTNVEGPQLVPVNFALIENVIYFRTLSDGFLAQLAHGHPEVAFGVDYHADLYRDGWNVTVKGEASQAEDRATINTVLGHGRLRPWAGGVRPMVIRIEIASVAGRRVSGH